MNEAITFTKIYTEIVKNLNGMSKIKLLLTWITVNGLDREFPKEEKNIKSLLRKIETQLVSRTQSDKRVKGK